MFEHLTDANGHNDKPHESNKAEVEPVPRVVYSCACESLDHLPHGEAVGHILSVDCRRMGEGGGGGNTRGEGRGGGGGGGGGGDKPYYRLVLSSLLLHLKGVELMATL